MMGQGVGERIRQGGMLALTLLASGCGGMYNAETAFSADFSCPGATAEETDAPHRYRVHGCGRTATYVCLDDARGLCAIQTTDEPRRESDDDLRRTRGPAPTNDSEVRVENTDDAGSGRMTLELTLEGNALLRFTAAPETHSDIMQIKLVQRDDDHSLEKCPLDFMVNGQILAMPKAALTRYKRGITHRVQVGQALIAEFGTAEKIALRVCKAHFSLKPEQVYKVRELVDRFQQELAWKAPAHDGPTGGMVAPAGGWPAWSAGAASLTALSGAALDPRELFKRLSVSVFQLEAGRTDSTSQGSAVAISKTELLTNCHVVQGALKLTLKQNKKEWPATLVRADPATDRCVVQISGTDLQPVAGLRSYASLEVGEPAYTLGSPVGLELTLSNGIVSGRREEANRHYVQTTAPISPGSSGGGLFDAHGNLIGITTLVLAGSTRLNQALNFAIPADAFWEP
jgi:hypothetical protein